jgi:hypothetical protein
LGRTTRGEGIPVPEVPERDAGMKGSGITEGVAVELAVAVALVVEGAVAVVVVVGVNSEVLAVMLLEMVRATDRGTEDWETSLSVIHL